MSKKIIIIILIILVIIAVDVIGYVFLFQNRPSNQAKTPANTGSDNPFPVAPALVNNESNTSSTTSASSSLPIGSTVQDPVQEVPSGPAVSSIGVINYGSSTKTFILDKASGNIYQILEQGENLRLTNTTIQQAQEVLWGKDKEGIKIIVRHLNSGRTESLFGTISETASTSSDPSITELKTKILPSNTIAYAVNPKKDQLFTLSTKVGGIEGFTSDLSQRNRKKVFDSSFSDWGVNWPSELIVSFTTKPSYNIPGNLFFLNLKTGAFSSILNKVNGLTALVSPSGQKVIYSKTNSANSFDLYLADLKQNKISRLGITTLPEKCIWSSDDLLYCAVPKKIPSGNYPDDWYLGKVQFSDDWWKIDTKTGNAYVLSNNQSNRDLVNVAFDLAHKTLYAVDKGSGQLTSQIIAN